MKRHRSSGVLRLISAVVLCFFTWSFGGVFDIAYAVTNSKQAGKSSQQAAISSQSAQPIPLKPEEKFQKTIEDITQILNDTSTDTGTKKNKLRGKRSEIESYDTEIRKHFTATENKLKNEGLPPEILERHYKFVRHYDDNLNELKNNLDDIEKAKTKSEADAAIGRAKAHLEKVRPPKKHIPLDPNKLPHRTAEPVFIEPRTSPEQFTEGVVKQAKGEERRPILVASNGSLSGLLSPNTLASASLRAPSSVIARNEVTKQSQDSLWAGSGEAISQTMLLAAANPPTSAELAETIEVKFTPAIQAKAQELGHNPTKIYNWVRNNIEYGPTYGSIQGADMCLQTKQCNDFDTASLLIALLRASGIHAKYVYGTVEIPIEKVKNWLGGFTDSMAALNLLASARIPVKGMTEGGEIKYVRMEHVWVEAWIDYIPSRGARHRSGQGDTWIPLDASVKQYAYTQGIDIKSAVPFDAQSFIDQIKATATINEQQGYVTGVNSLLIQQTMTDYQTQVQNYISQNYPNATVGDVLGKKDIVKQEFTILLGTLPYRTIVTGSTYASIPDSLRHKLNFNVIKDIYDSELGTPINITKSLPELAGKKITLSYSPATQADENVINSYLPKPHADGTPIQPNELPSSLPAYLINLKPELRINGVVVATGTPIGMGNKETFKMTFIAPNESPDVITNQIEAGEYLGIALDLGRVSQEEIRELKARLQATKKKLESSDFSGLTRDDILGDLLYMTALSYHADLGVSANTMSKMMGVAAITMPSETIFSFDLKSNYAFGIPLSVSAGELSMDADRLVELVKALNGDKEKPKKFMAIVGANGSALEHSVPEQVFGTATVPAQGISAVKALRIANEQGLPIYSINQTNIDGVLPQLQLDSGTVSDIRNAVNAGKEVIASKSEITLNGWTGCGYIIYDPVTRAGAYMISGGMSGAMIVIASIANWLMASVSSNVEAAGSPEFVPDDLLAKKDPDCVKEIIFGCAKQAVMDAIWDLYFPIVEVACLLIIKNVLICSVVGAIELIIALIINWEKTRKCMNDKIMGCPDLPPELQQ